MHEEDRSVSRNVSSGVVGKTIGFTMAVGPTMRKLPPRRKLVPTVGDTRVVTMCGKIE